MVIQIILVHPKALGLYSLLEKVFLEKPLNGMITVRLSLATLEQ